ncbi:MAG: hypothetical protein ACOY94_13665 [Bacillota bacterium]
MWESKVIGFLAVVYGLLILLSPKFREWSTRRFPAKQPVWVNWLVSVCFIGWGIFVFTG